MTLYVTEHANILMQGRGGLTNTPLAAYSLTSASTAPFPSARAQYIRVSADTGMYLNVIQATTALTLTSTNAMRIAPNVTPELIAISTANRVLVQST